jgi:hypothetical protein
MGVHVAIAFASKPFPNFDNRRAFGGQLERAFNRALLHLIDHSEVDPKELLEILREFMPLSP